jgi:hypothetical protein
MAMHPCPHCGGPGISAARKLWLSDLFPARCRTCGGRIGVTASGLLLTIIPLATAVVLAEYLFPADRRTRLLVVLAGSVVSSVLHLRCARLVRR